VRSIPSLGNFKLRGFEGGGREIAAALHAIDPGPQATQKPSFMAALPAERERR
jgi:hypothetical protein